MRLYNLAVSGCAVCLIVASAGCTTSKIDQGLAYQDRGEYVQAFEHFQAVSESSPSNREYIRYRNTARGLAFRQCVGLANKALANDDLDGFVSQMSKANEIQPNQKVRNVVSVVTSARAQGKTDTEIRAELRSAMGMHVKEGTIREALSRSAGRIEEKLTSGAVKQPVSVLGFTMGGTGKANGGCRFFETEFASMLLKKGVKVVDRNNIEKIQKEIQMTLSGLTSDEQVVEIGKIAGARSMVTGNLFSAGNKVKYQITLVDVETSKVIFSDSELFIPDEEFLKMLK